MDADDFYIFPRMWFLVIWFFTMRTAMLCDIWVQQRDVIAKNRHQKTQHKCFFVITTPVRHDLMSIIPARVNHCCYLFKYKKWNFVMNHCFQAFIECHYDVSIFRSLCLGMSRFLYDVIVPIRWCHYDVSIFLMM